MEQRDGGQVIVEDRWVGQRGEESVLVDRG